MLLLQIKPKFEYYSIVQIFFIYLVNLFIIVYQETLCYVRYICKVKETNAWNTIQSMLFHVSFSLRHIFLSVLAFKFHNQINTMIETNTDLDNV